MGQKYSAVIRQNGEWWIGWVKETITWLPIRTSAATYMLWFRQKFSFLAIGSGTG